jgi:aminocarboxymuconate-semialdehyde decarboxylase
MSSLIYEGVMDRFPGLKIVMAHGGGYMPHYMGRLDRNVTDKPYTARNLSKKPSEYLSDFYYDSCVYDPRTLEILVERVGIKRVVLGGDYPVAALDPIDFLDATALPDRDRAQIAGGNACQLLGI